MKTHTFHADGSQPQPGEIFVFGSNQAGYHGGGAARAAATQYGAEFGVSEGLTGIPVRLALKVVDATCQAISGAKVKIWHTQITGSYSGNTPNDGMCLKSAAEGEKHDFRGVQTTDENVAPVDMRQLHQLLELLQVTAGAEQLQALHAAGSETMSLLPS